MPALAYRRRAFRTKPRKPKRFLWTVVSPITYDKTGSLTSGALMSGVSEFVPGPKSALVRYPYPVIVRYRRQRMRR